MPALKNDRWERFAQGLAKGVTAGDAYVQAGYKPNDGNASRLKGNEKVEARVEELRNRGADRAEISIERVLRELGRIGFSDLRGAFDENGNLKRPEDWSDDLAGAISAVEVVTRNIGDGQVEYVHKLRLWDKNSALEKIAKHLGMFIERVDHTSTDGTMSPAAALDVTKLSVEDKRVLMALREKATGGSGAGRVAQAHPPAGKKDRKADHRDGE